MKKIILFFSLTFATVVTGYSQTTDNRLLSVYSESEINQIKQTDITLYNALIYGLDNATYITAIPKEKKMENLKSITLPKGDYTFASLGIKIEELSQFFQINGTDKMLVVKSIHVLKNELENKKQ